jgi:hypothetical protein
MQFGHDLESDFSGVALRNHFLPPDLQKCDFGYVEKGLLEGVDLTSEHIFTS